MSTLKPSKNIHTIIEDISCYFEILHQERKGREAKGYSDLGIHCRTTSFVAQTIKPIVLGCLFCMEIYTLLTMSHFTWLGTPFITITAYLPGGYLEQEC